MTVVTVGAVNKDIKMFYYVYDVLPNFFITTSEMMRDYYL